jgi:protein phosphatase 1 regulatory subunit 16A
MASHEELLSELPRLEKLSHAQRLKRAKKRREEQLKKYRATLVDMVKRKKKTPAKISFEINAVLLDLISRNDVKGGD